MRTVLLVSSIFTLANLGLFAQAGTQFSPQATFAEPKVVKPGTVITIRGVALGSKDVAEVFLTDQRFDMKVKVLEQTDNSLKIRVPPFAKPGRQQLLLLTSGKSPAYLEQPVYVLVEIDEEAAKPDPPKRTAAPASAGDKANNGSDT